MNYEICLVRKCSVKYFASAAIIMQGYEASIILFPSLDNASLTQLLILGSYDHWSCMTFCNLP